MIRAQKTPPFIPPLVLLALTLLLPPLAYSQLPANACLSSASNLNATSPPTLSQKNELPRKGGGWDALTHLLDAAKPNVDTQLPPSPSQITEEIEILINNGHYDAALTKIKQRLADLAAHPPRSGTDVQLAFQHARALAAIGCTREAIAHYTLMTTRFPELSEPWNNLATLYAAQGKLGPARKALENALRAAPNNATAHANLTTLQSLQTQHVGVNATPR